MTATYDPSAIPDFEKDWVRFETTDTDMTAPFLQDEEIDARLSLDPTPQHAALACMYLVAGKMARPSFHVGDIATSANAIASSTYAKRIKDKENEYGLSPNAARTTTTVTDTVRTDTYYGAQ